MTQWYLLGCILFKILNSYANKDQSMRISKSYLIKSFIYQVGQPPSLLFGRDSKAARGVGKLSNGERERLQVSSDVCWSVQARGELTRSGISYTVS